jgi:hypothetical protein
VSDEGLHGVTSRQAASWPLSWLDGATVRQSKTPVTSLASVPSSPRMLLRSTAAPRVFGFSVRGLHPFDVNGRQHHSLERRSHHGNAETRSRNPHRSYPGEHLGEQDRERGDPPHRASVAKTCCSSAKCSTRPIRGCAVRVPSQGPSSMRRTGGFAARRSPCSGVHRLSDPASPSTVVHHRGRADGRQELCELVRPSS